MITRNYWKEKQLHLAMGRGLRQLIAIWLIPGNMFRSLLRIEVRVICFFFYVGIFSTDKKKEKLCSSNQNGGLK